MVEVSEIGIKEDELELELGLSIGGSFRKLSDTPKPVERESGFPVDSKSNGFHLDLKEILTAATSRSRATSPTVFESEREVPDPKTKRKIHALRRQEAKKKQKEKRCRGRNSINSSDSQTVSEDQQRASKREKTAGSNGVENGTPNPIYGGQTVHCGSVGPAGLQYSYAPVQFVPYTNGFAYPCVVPCWAPSPSPSPPPPPSGGKEKNGVFQPVACCGFRPFVAAHPGLGLSLPNGCNSEKSGGKDGESRKTASYGSPVCSSSTVSDHHNSSSREGDGSSETRTQSSHSSAEQNRGDSPKPNDIKGPSPEVQSSCSQQTESAQSINTDEFKEQAKPGFDSAALEKPMFTTENSSPNSLSKDVGKPPKPQSLSRSLTPPPAAFRQMPYVSTRGNGPKGKTIYGFLYRYTNSEVSIVCVCHGSTFSPAEFVQHAGGTDVSQPLKHITVMPSAFG